MVKKQSERSLFNNENQMTALQFILWYLSVNNFSQRSVQSIEQNILLKMMCDELLFLNTLKIRNI